MTLKYKLLQRAMDDKYLPFLLGVGHQIDNQEYGVVQVIEPSKMNDLHKRSKMLCVETVPSYMIPGELLRFFATIMSQIMSIKIYRHYTNPEVYLAIVLLESHESALQMITDYNQQLMSSLEENTYCQLSLVVGFEFNNDQDNENLSEKSSLLKDLHSEVSSSSLISENTDSKLKDIANEQEFLCPVCLEAFSSLLPLSFTTCCKHRFHIDCIMRLEGPQCPVCR